MRWCLMISILALGLPAAAQEASRRVMDFSAAERPTRGWFSVDDSVMGGVSHGHFEQTEDGVSFFGRLSLENNGGFSSVRSPAIVREFDGAERLRLRVRGDGRSYDLCLKKTADWDGPLYRTTFDTVEGEWMEVDLPLSVFVPTWRGWVVERAGPITGQEIAQLGFMLADKQPGEFELEVAWIEAR